MHFSVCTKQIFVHQVVPPHFICMCPMVSWQVSAPSAPGAPWAASASYAADQRKLAERLVDHLLPQLQPIMGQTTGQQMAMVVYALGEVSGPDNHRAEMHPLPSGHPICHVRQAICFTTPSGPRRAVMHAVCGISASNRSCRVTIQAWCPVVSRNAQQGLAVADFCECCAVCIDCRTLVSRWSPRG